MIYLVAALLLMSVWALYRLGGRTLASPGLVVAASFAFVTVVACGLAPLWRFDLVPLTAATLVGSVWLFGLADLASQRWLTGRRPELADVRPARLLAPRRHALAGILVLQAISLVLVLGDVFRVAREGWSDGGWLQFLNAATIAIAYGRAEYSSVTKFVLLLSQAMMAVAAYVGLQSLLARRTPGSWLPWFVPLGLYLGTVLLTGDRLELIHGLTFLLTLALLLGVRAGSVPRLTRRVVGLGAAAVVVVLGAFVVMGLLTGKTQKMGALALPTYVGSSIPALNDYLATYPAWTGRTFFGAHTLGNIYDKLALFGLQVDVPRLPLEFRKFDDGAIEANLYTALRRYLQDYTYVGLVVILIGLALLYRWALLRTLAALRTQVMWSVSLALLSYPLFEMAIEERFLTKVVGLGTPLLLVLVWGAILVLTRNGEDLEGPIGSRLRPLLSRVLPPSRTTGTESHD